MSPPTPLLVVLAGIALFLVLAMLRLWLGVLLAAACLVALVVYALVGDGDG